MDAPGYLKSYGWKDGEALRLGGLRKPILVKHKKDTKGLGNGYNDADMWWERLFDGQLKSIETSQSSNGEISVKHDIQKAESDARKALLPLYRMFVKGKGLAGTVGNASHVFVNTRVDIKKIETSNSQLQDTATKQRDNLLKHDESVLKKKSRKVKLLTEIGSKGDKRRHRKEGKDKKKSKKRIKNEESGELGTESSERKRKKHPTKRSIDARETEVP